MGCNTVTQKRTKGERLEDFAFITRLYVQGKPQRTIVEELAKVRNYKLSRSMIAREIKRILSDWLEYRNQKVDRHVADALMRIDTVEQEGWDSWLKSKEPKKTTRVSVKGAPATDQPTGPMTVHHQEKATTSVERLGDTRYMAVVQWAIEQRCKILGSYAAFKADLAFNEDSPLHVALSASHDDRVKRISTLLGKSTRSTGLTLIQQIKEHRDNGGNGSDRSGAN